MNTVLFHRHCTAYMYYVLFCSLAVLDPRVGHTMDVLSRVVFQSRLKLSGGAVMNAIRLVGCII